MKVSVIIPNYNHASFLKQRIESVLNQTFQNIELIILDDCSSDNSQVIIEGYRGNNKISNIHFNESNTGNTFQQWQKGIEMAKGEFIWIAESDDYCNLNFLEELMPLIQQKSNTAIAYAKSIRVDEDGNYLDDLSFWYDEFEKGRWKTNYFNQGKDEIKKYLSKKNTIPNASAVIFKTSLIDFSFEEIQSFTLCGDWLFWIKLLERGAVAYTVKTINYFRTHQNSVRKYEEKNNTSMNEKKRINHYLIQNDLIRKEKRSFWTNMFSTFNSSSVKGEKK